MSHCLRLAAIAACSLTVVACGADDDPGPVLATGLLTVQWSVLSGFDPGACAAFGADGMELVVYDDLGGVVTEVQPPCEDFAVSVELLDGFYAADATLVDAADFAVTTTLPLNDLDIVAGSELVVDIDFPSDSFIAGP